MKFRISRMNQKQLTAEDGKQILKNAARHLVDGRHISAEPRVVTAKERPLFDALHILASLSNERDLSWVNVSEAIAWLLDEAEESHVGVKSANA